MKVMLLAAGRGTRLGALGRALPKPLVPICGYPAIFFGLAACVRAGLYEVIVNLHHHGELLRRALGDGGALGVHVTYSNETVLLGTGGGLAHARPLLGAGPVVVMNAKVVADVDLRGLIAAHEGSGADATLVLRDDPDARSWGAISTDDEGRVVGILGAVSPRAAKGSVVDRMFTGIQIIGPKILDRLRPIFSDSVRDGYMPALQEGADIRAVVLPGYFAEHSTPERYLASNLALLRDPQLISHPPGPLTGIDPRARVHPDAAIIAPVRIEADAVIEAKAILGPEVVVGRGAIVRSGAHVSHAVLWPAAEVQGDAKNTVLMAPDAQGLCEPTIVE
jgi:mannose-1-phosphate guanylyltransferase